VRCQGEPPGKIRQEGKQPFGGKESSANRTGGPKMVRQAQQGGEVNTLWGEGEGAMRQRGSQNVARTRTGKGVHQPEKKKEKRVKLSGAGGATEKHRPFPNLPMCVARWNGARPFSKKNCPVFLSGNRKKNLEKKSCRAMIPKLGGKQK